MKYNILPEFKRHSKDIVPLNPIILKIVNFMMPIVQKQNSPFENELEVEEIKFKSCTAQLIKPKVKKDIPCLVYFHGGGFVLKASQTHKNLVREYAYKGNMAVLFVDYRLAPKYKFPIPMQDCYESYLWAVSKFTKQRIYVGGDSAGGNLALGVTRKAIEKNNRIPDKLLLIYPVVDTRMITNSMKEFTDTPIWDAKLNAKMWDLYTKKKDRHNILVSPIEADNFYGFPECYIETAEFDCLRDEGINLANHLKLSDVSVEIVNTKGTIHGFDVEEKSDCVRECIQKRIVFLNKGIDTNSNFSEK